MQHVEATYSERGNWGQEDKTGDHAAQGHSWRAGLGAEAAKAETGQGWVMSHGMMQKPGA